MYEDNPSFSYEILKLRETYGKDIKRHRPATQGSDPSSTPECRTGARDCSRSSRAFRPLLNCVPVNDGDCE